MKIVRGLFIVGMTLGLAYFVGALMAIRLDWFQGLLNQGAILGYDAASVVHVLLLAHFTSRLEGADRRGATGWLYTTGFLHTLLALGITITLAAVSARGGSDPSQVIIRTLAPMGAAVIPHFVGVTAGQLIEQHAASSGTRESSFLQQLTQDAGQARDTLKLLYADRETALREEVQALRDQGVEWRSLSREATQLVAVIKAALTDVQTTYKQLAVDSRTNANAVSTSLKDLSKKVGEAEASAKSAALQLGEVAKNAKGTSDALKEATKVVDDLKTLHASIVDLLSHALFKA
jgi:methyl-accepting chemotaxis protein